MTQRVAGKLHGFAATLSGAVDRDRAAEAQQREQLQQERVRQEAVQREQQRQREIERDRQRQIDRDRGPSRGR